MRRIDLRIYLPVDGENTAEGSRIDPLPPEETSILVIDTNRTGDRPAEISGTPVTSCCVKHGVTLSLSHRKDPQRYDLIVRYDMPG